MRYIKAYKIFENYSKYLKRYNESVFDDDGFSTYNRGYTNGFDNDLYRKLKKIIHNQEYYNNTWKEVKKLLLSVDDKERKNLINYKNSKYSFNLFQIAINIGDNDTMRLLLEFGADPNMIVGNSSRTLQNSLYLYLHNTTINLIVLKMIIYKIDDITEPDQDNYYVIDYLYDDDLEWFKNNYQDEYKKILKIKQTKKFKI